MLKCTPEDTLEGKGQVHELPSHQTLPLLDAGWVHGAEEARERKQRDTARDAVRTRIHKRR